MRLRVVIIMLLSLLYSTELCNAQGFLQNLGKSIKKEIEKELTNEVNKKIDKLKDNLKDKKQDQKSQEQQPEQSQGQNDAVSKSTPAPKSTPVVNPTDVPITKMGTWLFVIKDGKPHYKFLDSTSAQKENYYLDDIKYEHPDGVKPFTYTTAVATFKAKDGYYFDTKLQLNDRTLQAENTTGFKRIDAKTVKVYLTAFTGGMEFDIRITPAMVEYKKKISDMHLTAIATAKMNFPLFDYWSKKQRWGDELVESIVDKNMRSKYAYPTTEEHRATENLVVTDAKRSKYPSNYTITSIDILDDDLSDDIPGLVGEWCLIGGKKFIPKSCLKDIKAGSKYADGAPAQIIDSPFEFAGGSGTFEDPYLIKTAEQLNAVRKGPTNHYKLIADIDLSQWGNWVPIGGTAAYGFMGGGWDQAEKGAHTFLGSFDGNGHIISGMQIVINEPTPYLTEGENMRAYGLFANIGTNPAKYKIQNLGVVNFNIDINYTDVKTTLRLYAAAISGGMNQGVDMLNCYSKGGRININVKCNDAYKPTGEWGELPKDAPYIHINAGGLCSNGGGSFSGNLRKNLEFTHIEKCFNDSDITVNVQNCKCEIYGAGIIASMGETHIHECYNSGNITLPLDLNDLLQQTKGTYAAGIAAFAFIRDIPAIYHFSSAATSFIQNCYNSGQIIGRNAAGIFNFSISDIHLENCYNAGTIIGNEFDHSSGGCSIDQIISQASGVVPYGKEYIRNCTSNGNAVTGTMWKTSTTLGRKVLAAIPEDTHPSNKYNVEPANIGTLTDVKADVWYADAVRWALDKNIIGESATTFSPNKTCTKAEYYTLLWSAAGSPKMSGTNSFSDVKTTHAYYDAALWAKDKGLVSGSTFAPQTAITRGELVISLWKYLGCPEGLQANQYLDIDSHQSDFGRAVSWSHIRAVMGATERNKFSPQKSITKAEVINIMHRALK